MVFSIGVIAAMAAGPGAAADEVHGPPRDPRPAGGSLADLSGAGSGHGIGNGRNVPADVVAADFNRDGRQDLAIAYAYDDLVVLYYATGGGQYEQGEELPVGVLNEPGNDLPRRVIAADFDRDGLLDIAVLCSGNTNIATRPSVGILYGLPKGGFEAFRPIALWPENADPPQFSVTMAAGAIDDNDSLDLVIGHLDSHQITILRQETHRQWRLPVLKEVNAQGGAGPVDLELADIDFDGHPDLVVINERNLQIWRGEEDGLFSAARQLGPVAEAGQTFFTATALADLDRNGFLDLAVLNRQSAQLRLLMDLEFDEAKNNTAGVVNVALPNGSGPVDLRVLDADLNGYPDLAVLYRNRGDGQVFLGGPTSGGGGPFSPGGALSAARLPRSLAVCRVNEDPWPDLVIVNEGDTEDLANDDVAINLGAPPDALQSYFRRGENNASVAAAVPPGLRRPVGLAWDPVHESLWTIDRAERRLVELKAGGTIVRRLPMDEIAYDGFEDPVDLAADGDGGFWAVDRMAAKIIRLTRNGEPIGSFATAAAGLSRPLALAFDDETFHLFVADELEPGIVEMTADGARLRRWRIPDNPRVSGLDWDAASERLWVATENRPDRLLVLRLERDEDDEHSEPGGDVFATIDDTVDPGHGHDLLEPGRVRAVASQGTSGRRWVLMENGLLAHLLESGEAANSDLIDLTVFRSIRAVVREPGGTRLIADGGPLGTIFRLNEFDQVVATFRLALELERPASLTGLARSPEHIYALDGRGAIMRLAPNGEVQQRFGGSKLEGRHPRGLHYDAATDSLLIGLAGRILRWPLSDTMPGALEPGDDDPQTHLVAADFTVDSISAGARHGTFALFSGVDGRVALLDDDLKPTSILTLAYDLPAGFTPLGIQPLNPSGIVWQLYGNAAGELPEAILQQPASAVGTGWMLYR
jgi:hypothetical protein